MNIESKLISWLNSQGLSATAYSSPPANTKPPYVTVERVGGPGDRFVDRPSVVVQSWGATKAKAEALSREVDKVILEGLADGRFITSCSRNSLIDYPDSKDRPRYQAVYDIVAREGA